MALNKRKVLDAARKHAQKGAKEKALKEYGKLLKEDSRDAKLLLEIGDAHRRWGQNEEAISHYTKVAEQYKQGGFDARAVAVFKQIINLDAKRYGAYVSLAELYQRMGLDSEAGNALQTAADGYHKEGQKTEALELLRKMATLDPSNTTSRMKVADLLRQEKMVDDAVSEYEAVAEELVRQGDTEQLVTVYERVLEIQPERDDVEFALARALIQLSQTDKAEPYARRAFDKAPDTEGYFDLLNTIYTELGRTDALSEVTKQMAQIHRDHGDDDKARELMQRLPGDDALSLDTGSGFDTGSGASDDAFGQPGDDDLLDDGFLDDDFLAEPGTSADSDEDSFIDIGDEDDALELSDPAEEMKDLAADGPSDADPDEPADAAAAAAADDDAAPEGDPDQLFAEASVYLRYGKRDQAIASLEAILSQEPRHRDALEKIGECYADAGDAPRAVDYWKQAAHLAMNAHDTAALDVLRERIAVLDPDAAAEFAPSMSAPAQAPEASQPADMDDMDDEIELDLDVEEDDADITGFGDDDEISLEASPDESLEDMEAGEVSEIEVDVDVELDDDSVAFDMDEQSATTDVDLADEADEAELSLAGEVDLEDVGGIDVEVSIDDDDDDDGDEDEGDGEALDEAKVAEDLEEAEFYMEQELFDEAETIYKRILETSPNHPGATLRLGELQAARGDAPASSAGDLDVTLDPSELPFAESDGPDAVPDVDEADDAALGENSELEIAVEFDAGDADEDDTAGVDMSAADNTMPLVSTETVAVEAQEDDDDSFDLAAELRETLEEEEEAEAQETAAGEPTSEEEGFASIFKDFKSGVEKTLGDDDFETRFDLGIAYRGMELYDDALGEFRLCLDSPNHRLESLHMMGLCAIDLERFSDATNHLEQALSSGDVPDPKQAGLRFDLGRAFEGAEDYDRAKDAFESARAIDASIPSIDECIERVTARIRGDAPVELADASQTQSEGGFESFDDLVAEVEAEEEPEVEAFESFDDVVAEAEAGEAVIETAEVVEEEEDEAPVTLADVDPNQSASESGDDGDAPRKRKKKRISFV